MWNQGGKANLSYIFKIISKCAESSLNFIWPQTFLKQKWNLPERKRFMMEKKPLNELRYKRPEIVMPI